MDTARNRSPITSLIEAGRARTRGRGRSDRSARRQLERDVATYTTAADLADLSAALDRYDDSQTQQVRELLNRQRFHAA